jgi:aspartate-semialdehyde dehydrogenase
MVLINKNYKQIFYGVYDDDVIIILNEINMKMLNNNTKLIYAPTCLILQS